MNAFQKKLKILDACKSGLDWAKGQTDIERAWWMCQRADWLLWLAVKLGVAEKQATIATCELAKLVLPFTKDHRPWTAQIMAEHEAWDHGAETRDNLWIAAQDARQAADEAKERGDHAASNAAFAGMYAAFTAAEGMNKQRATGIAKVVAEAAAYSRAAPAEREIARQSMQLACTYIVRNRINASLVTAAWKAHFARSKTRSKSGPRLATRSQRATQ